MFYVRRDRPFGEAFTTPVAARPPNGRRIEDRTMMRGAHDFADCRSVADIYYRGHN